MMRAVWIDAGNDPAYAKLAANGITWPYFDARESRLTSTYLSGVKAHTVIDGCGLYVVASWFPSLDGPGLAEWMHERLLDIGWLGNAPIQFDIEVANLVPYALACLKRWRELRPKRVTDLTLEGHKGGLFRYADAVAVAGAMRYVVPQCYDATMTPWDTWAMAYDLWAAGFPVPQVAPFYDAAHLPEWWGVPAGYAFTQGRLP